MELADSQSRLSLVVAKVDLLRVGLLCAVSAVGFLLGKPLVLLHLQLDSRTRRLVAVGFGRQRQVAVFLIPSWGSLAVELGLLQGGSLFLPLEDQPSCRLRIAVG